MIGPRHSQYGSIRMIQRHIHGRGIKKEESLSQTAFFFGNAREPLQFLSARNRQDETRLSVVVVVEEDGLDDLTSRSGESEADAEERFDIRDLLLDETD
jgi:hypothetical protein